MNLIILYILSHHHRHLHMTSAAPAALVAQYFFSLRVHRVVQVPAATLVKI